MRLFIVLNLMILNAVGTIAAMGYFAKVYGSMPLFILSAIVGMNIAVFLFRLGLGPL